MALTKEYVDRFPGKAHRHYGVFPLAALPNQAGFCFIGVSLDGVKVDCHVAHDTHQYHHVVGIDYDNLIGWKNHPSV